MKSKKRIRPLSRNSQAGKRTRMEDAEIISDLLSLVGYNVKPNEIAGWKQEDRDQ